MAGKALVLGQLSSRLKAPCSSTFLRAFWRNGVHRGLCTSVSKPGATSEELFSVLHVPDLYGAVGGEDIANIHRVFYTLTEGKSVMAHSDGPLKGITTHRLSKGITFYANENTVKPAVSGQAKPLLLLLPWLASRPQAQAKYCEIYLRTGFDVLVVESNLGHFLWPRWGLEYSAQVLQLLESERFSDRPMVVHAFSVGGYTFAQLVVHVAKDTQRYQGLLNRVKGQIYDSLVIGSLDHMAIGVSKTLFPRFEYLMKSTSLLYFHMFKRQTVDYFNASIDVFWNTPLTAPALYYFCDNDVMCDSEVTHNLVEHWKRRGITVTSQRWEKSVHAGHLRAHPQEYLSVLQQFLSSLNILPLKSKM